MKVVRVILPMVVKEIIAVVVGVTVVLGIVMVEVIIVVSSVVAVIGEVVVVVDHCDGWSKFHFEMLLFHLAQDLRKCWLFS